MAKRKQSTAELIGISNFSRNGLQTKSQGEIVYFLVQPTNISVLSEQSVAIKIQHLMQLLSVQPDIEIICLNNKGEEHVFTLPELLPHSFGPEFLV